MRTRDVSRYVRGHHIIEQLRGPQATLSPSLSPLHYFLYVVWAGYDSSSIHYKFIKILSWEDILKLFITISKLIEYRFY
jgi:hypothetical protein